MRAMKRLIIIVLLFSATVGANAQQLLSSGDYLISDFALSPAYAGSTGNIEGFASMGKYLSGIDGAPVRRAVSINGPLSTGMGVGVSILNESYGIFNDLSVLAAYSYNYRLTSDVSVTLGLNAGIRDNRLNLNQFSTNDDPVLISEGSIRGVSLDAGFGCFAEIYKAHIGFTAMNLLPSTVENKDQGIEVYSLTKQYRFWASYRYDISRDVKLTPYIVLNQPAASPLHYEVSLLARYKGTAMAGVQYRTSGYGLIVGAIYDWLAVSYVYGFGGTGIYAASTGSHEISLGVRISKSKKPKNSVFDGYNAAPYQEW